MYLHDRIRFVDAHNVKIEINRKIDPVSRDFFKITLFSGDVIESRRPVLDVSRRGDPV